MPLRPGDKVSLVQNSAGKLIFILEDIPNEEYIFLPFGFLVTGWYIELWVKRNTDDNDSVAIISSMNNQPTRTGSHSDGSGLYIYNEFGWDLTPMQTMYAPGEYPGEILFWTGGAAAYAAGDPPSFRIPITWEILQAIDLPADT